MRLSKAVVQALVDEYVEMEQEAEASREKLVELEGERAWLGSDAWSPREKAIYYLGWDQAKAVGLERGIRAVAGREGIDIVCDAYEKRMGVL